MQILIILNINEQAAITSQLFYYSMTNNTGFLNQKFGYTFSDLFSPDKLKNLTDDFYEFYKSNAPEKFSEFINYNSSQGSGLTPIQISCILIDASYTLSDFIVELFQLTGNQKKFFEEIEYEKDILNFKKEFVQRKVYKKFKPENLKELDWSKLDAAVTKFKEKAFPDFDFLIDEEKFTAKMILELMELEKNYRWYFEKDKFAPENFEIPENVIERTGAILAAVKEARIFDLPPDTDELNNLRIILDELQKWLYAKKFNDPNTKKWISYFDPQKLDYERLAKYDSVNENALDLIQSPADRQRDRFGFKLTDNRWDTRRILNHVDYCMYCHDRDKDSCSKGIKDKTGGIKKNPLGITLNGCPLNEKISEMHFVRKAGFPIASLALIVIDNPMLAGTGHRICNDCMKACIFQTQEPVNIPQIETSALTDVLKLPYGFEIYSLLTRWNPLNIKRPYAMPYNGKNVMVIGMGPAGYTLSHYLLNEGCGVIGIDALKIERVQSKYSGEKNANGFVKFPEPVRDYQNEIRQELDERILQGFGGVSEYGITVRWDKNFLTAIYINLARREKFRLYDGVRFGGTITIEDAWNFGVDHIAIAAGAGKPTIIDMKNNLIRGIRKASDFLMALQLTGAAKRNNLTNLQVQLPAFVIGGGLTAIDTATELMAYYPVQVLKALEKYEKIIAEFSEDEFWKKFDDEEKEVMNTFIRHGRDIRNEIQNAKKENRKPHFLKLLNEWGGVTIAYRKRLLDSPAYRLNHEEIIEGLSEGIRIAELQSPVEVIPDKFGAVEKIVFEKQIAATDPETNRTKFSDSGELQTVRAKSVMVAAGTSPNIIYEKEYPGTFELDEKKYFFKPFTFVKNENGQDTLKAAGKEETGFFTSYSKDGKYISFYGDNHPRYNGNVVKAMASAKDGYEKIMEVLNSNPVKASAEAKEKIFENLVSEFDSNFIATVKEIVRLTPSIVEVIVNAPMAAKKFRPGQFYRLQNYETMSRKIGGIDLTMEGLAMTGAWTDVEKGLLSMIVLEIGVSTKLVSDLKKGERVVVMGPTGTPTTIPSDQTVLLAGGGLGNAVLFSIAEEMKRRNNKILYFAGYKDSSDVYKMEELEKSSDQIIWCNDIGELITPRRKQDLTFKGNIVQAMAAYADRKLGHEIFDLKDVSRIIAIGSDRMMNAVKVARHSILKDKLGKHVGIGSINSTMQCMMKEICAQCLQRHIDPVTGEESFVFSCFNQDQHLDEVDFENLNSRLKANSVLEKLSNLFFAQLISD